MCDATTLAVSAFAMQGLSSVQQFKAKRDMADAAGGSAASNLRLQYQALGARELEETQAAVAKTSEIERTAAASRGAVTAGAAAGGVSGLSVDLLLREQDRQAGVAKDTVGQNLEMTLAQIEREKLAARANALSQANSVPQPSPFSLGLRLGSAAAQTYADYRLRQPPKVVKKITE